MCVAGSGVDTELRGVEEGGGARRACGSREAGGEARAPLAASDPADAEDVERRRPRQHVRRRAHAPGDTCGQRQPSGRSARDDENDERDPEPEPEERMRVAGLVATVVPKARSGKPVVNDDDPATHSGLDSR